MEEVKEFLRDKGYLDEEINLIINTYPLNNMRPQSLLNNIKRNYEFLLQLGYTQEEIIKITKTSSTIYDYSIENIKQKIEDLKELGYTQEEVIKMTVNLPSLFGLSIGNIREKIEDIEQLGYSKEDIIKMTKTFPSIYSFDVKENIRKKIKDIEQLGYSKEEIIKMTINLPSLFGLSIENNIKPKIAFYDSIGLHHLAVVAPKHLMQSTALSYARYMFYKEKGININMSNYIKLFMRQKQFEKQYGIKNSELLVRYKYTEHLQVKSTQELGKEVIDELKDTIYTDETEKLIADNGRNTELAEEPNQEN